MHTTGAAVNGARVCASPLRLLVVSGDAPFAAHAGEMLEAADVAAAVDHATSVEAGGHALPVAGNHCVVLDTRDDTGAIDALRSISRADPRAPVVVIAARDDKDFVLAALEAGAQECVPWPATAAQLSAAVRRAVARTRGEPRRRLREAHERFRRAFDESPIGMGLLRTVDGRPGRFAVVNRAMAAIFGCPADALLEADVSSLVDERDRRALTAAVKAIAAGLDANTELDLRFALPDGDAGWLNLHVSAGGDRRAANPHVLVQAIDVTARRRAEAALRRSEAAKSAIVESAMDGVLAIDAEGRITEFNHAAQAIFGHAREDVIGRDGLDLIVPARDRARYRAALAAARAQGTAALLNQRTEIPAMRADGSEFPLELSIVATGGRQSGFSAFVRDLTATRRSEEIAARFAAIVASSADPIVGTDLDGTITSWNAAAERLYGYPADEALGRGVGMLYVDPDETSAVLSNVAAGRATPPYETRRRRRDGSLVPIEVSVSAVRDAAGEVIGSAAIARDLTAGKRAEAALRTSEQRYRTLISQLPDAAVIQYDRDMRIVFAEGPMLERVGRNPAELVGGLLSDLLSAERLEYFARHFREVLDGHAVSLEWETPGGHVLDLDIVPLRDEHDRIVGGTALARDVSERRRIERGLHFQAELLDRLDVAVIATDLEGRITHWNRQSESLYERPREQAIGMPVAEINTQYGLPDLLDSFERVPAGDRMQLELELPRSDGPVPILLSASPVQDEGGVVVGFAGAAIDVSHARQVARELHSARELFEGAFESAPVGIAIVPAGGERTGMLTRVNDALASMLGVPADELPGRHYRDFLHPEDAAAVSAVLEPLLAGKSAGAHGTPRLVTADGQTRWAQVHASLVRDTSGAPLHGVVCVLDVTDARHAQVEREALEARLHQSQKLDGMGRLAGGIAHDFNNLLAVIINYADLVAERLDGDRDLRADVEEIREAAERAAALTRQLLTFGRREVVQPRPIDVNAVLGDMEKLLRRTIGEDVELLTRREGGLWAVRADPSQIEQVLLNLTINARDAMPAGGTVTVSTTNVELERVYALQHAGVPPGRYVRITVGDSGSGMPPEVLERAFEPFFTTKPPGAGTGLGLATVYGIVKQAGGHVGLYSDDGQGTTVRITLPACLDAAETTAPGSPVAAPVGRGETVLVVEDDPAVRALATRLLAEAGYRVIDAQSPEEARQHAAHARMDLLVTDVIMPGMSGSQLAAVLAAQQPSLRVLFMSGYTDDVVMRHGLLERRLAFVDKPFTRASLLRGVRDALDGATGEHGVDA